MQDVTWLDRLGGDIAPTLAADGWYGGELVADRLAISALTWAADVTQAAARLDLTVQTDDPTLLPTIDSYTSPLGDYGGELHARAGLDNEQVPLGVFRIDSYESDPMWAAYRTTDRTPAVWVLTGGTVHCTGYDRPVAALMDASFQSPQQPASLSSVQNEIRHLCAGVAQVEDWSAIPDRTIPASLTYSTGGGSRWAAIVALADVIGYVPRSSPAGALDLVLPVPVDNATPDWVLKVGDRQAANVYRHLYKSDRTGRANVFVSSGTTPSGQTVQSSAQVTSGPLAVGGPYGLVTSGHQSPLLTSTSACKADAAAQRDRSVFTNAPRIPLTVPWNPALQLGDVLQLSLPGRQNPLLTAVQSIGLQWPLTDGMAVGVVAAVNGSWGG